MEAHGTALIFINFEQAAGFGHIGWGFHVGGEQYQFGSTDHLWNKKYPFWHPIELIRYMDVQPAKNTDSWSELGSKNEMLTTMRTGRHVRYHAYKQVSVSKPDLLAAQAFALSIRDRGWNVISNNCTHHTYNILTDYGADLPSAYDLANRLPKSWFGKIPGDQLMLVSTANEAPEPATRYPETSSSPFV